MLLLFPPSPCMCLLQTKRTAYLSSFINEHHLTAFTRQQRLSVQHDLVYEACYAGLLLEYHPREIQHQLQWHTHHIIVIIISNL